MICMSCLVSLLVAVHRLFVPSTNSAVITTSPLYLVKVALSLFWGLISLVYSRYNANCHKVSRMVADSEPSLQPVVPMLGMMGISLTFVAPGQHAQRVERVIGYTNARKWAVLASLSYVLPSQYDAYLDSWVADGVNHHPTSQSRPSAADVLVTGRRRPEHYKFPALTFGDVCLVSDFDDKRRRKAKVLDRDFVSVHKAELGVCLGYSREAPGCYDFVLANGAVRPRRVAELVSVHPFEWKRSVVYRSELPSIAVVQRAVQPSSSDVVGLPIVDPGLSALSPSPALASLGPSASTALDSFGSCAVSPLRSADTPPVLELPLSSFAPLSADALSPLSTTLPVVTHLVLSDAPPGLSSFRPLFVLRYLCLLCFLRLLRLPSCPLVFLRVLLKVFIAMLLIFRALRRVVLSLMLLGVYHLLCAGFFSSSMSRRSFLRFCRTPCFLHLLSLFLPLPLS